jgi:hypothetical protein
MTTLEELLKKASNRRAIDSIIDAMAFIDTQKIDTTIPIIMLSAEDVLTLQWRNETSGIALHFFGDGTGIYSIKTPEPNYAAIAFELINGLPAEVLSIINSYENTNHTENF